MEYTTTTLDADAESDEISAMLIVSMLQKDNPFYKYGYRTDRKVTYYLKECNDVYHQLSDDAYICDIVPTMDLTEIPTIDTIEKIIKKCKLIIRHQDFNVKSTAGSPDMIEYCWDRIEKLVISEPIESKALQTSEV